MLQHSEFKRLIETLPLPDQQAALELYWGAITTHSFWATPAPPRSVDLHRTDTIPFFSRVGEIFGIRESILKAAGQTWVFDIPGKTFLQASIELRVTPIVRRFVELINAERTMGKIAETIASEDHAIISIDEIRNTCSHVIESLLHYDLILLRDHSVPPICTW